MANDSALLIALAVGLALSSCNLSDPIPEQAAPQASWCESAEDCSGRGTCDVVEAVGVCLCDAGYRGLRCEECAAGFVMQGGQCTATTDVACDADLIEVDGQCVADACDEQCGEGSCTTTGEDTWLCECPDGTTGSDCDASVSCEETCGNGSCDEEGLCACDLGWAGEQCDECAPGYGGESCECVGADCITCEALRDTAWADGALARHAVIVSAPEDDVVDGVAVSFRFDHAALSGGGDNDPGNDVWLLYQDAEIDAVLGPDSRWNNEETTLLFATQAPIARGEVAIYYLYQGEPTDAPLRDAANVARQDRGWFHAGGEPLFATRSALEQPGVEGMVLQVRQIDVNTLEANFISRVQELGEITFNSDDFDTSLSDFSGTGSVSEPYVLRVPINTALISNQLIVSFDVYLATVSLPFGPSRIDLGSRTILSTSVSDSVSAVVSRSNVTTGTPTVAVCPVETP